MNKLPPIVRQQFSRRYPYLKIEFPTDRMPGLRPAAIDPPPALPALPADKTANRSGPEVDSALRIESKPPEDWLEREVGLSDRMTVRELEVAIMTRFGVEVLVFRKSGKFWIETRMTRDWTLKQQDDHGRDLEGSI